MPIFSFSKKIVSAKSGFYLVSRQLFVVVAVISLSACSWFAGEDPEAQEALLLSPLEIPPDLVSPKGDPRLVRPTLPKVKKSGGGALASLSPVDCQCDKPPSIGEQVLPQGKGVQRMREGQRRWLIVQAEPEQVWPLARGFLDRRGYRVLRDEPAIGMIETDWKPVLADEEHPVDKSGQANWRERLRIRIEPAGKAGYSEIFLSQRHSQRVSGSTSGSTPESTDGAARWELRPSDTDRAIEMLNRLAHHLAAENVQDAVPLKPVVAEVKIDDDGVTVLQLNTTFDIAWRRTSMALDNLGFTIEDHSRATGTFHVYNEISAGLTEEELKHSKPQDATVREEYRLFLQARGEYIHISMRTKSGKPDGSQVAQHVLTLLSGQFQ